MRDEPIGIDLETYSSVNLKTHGLDRYVSSPDFTILLVSISRRTGDYTYDMVFHPEHLDDLRKHLARLYLKDTRLVAHNAGFERATLTTIQINQEQLLEMLDSAVIARTQGAASSLRNSTRQLLPNAHKLDEGKELIRKFCVPNDWNGGQPPTEALIRADRVSYEQWQKFIEYCETDARGSRLIAERFNPTDSDAVRGEDGREQLTAKMNQLGWPVDLPLVKAMQARYEENVDAAKAKFRATFDPNGTLNFASPIQLKQWCADRGVRASSFDQDKVDALERKLMDKLNTMTQQDPKWRDYVQVHEMLRTKQIIGGSSLKKLKTILDQVGEDGRLRNQYLHCGAGQTYRTSGRGVQMQNLKRLSGDDLLDMDTVYDPAVELDNDTLGANLRQVFTASDPNGVLIVGDFSSVESRGLAWLAGADWKIEAYRNGQDMYKVLAAKLYGVPYDQVTKDQRKMGKLGELSCGYGAGPMAVGSMAEKLGLQLTEDQVVEVVNGWRDSNPEVMELWRLLDEMLHTVVNGTPTIIKPLDHDLMLEMVHIPTPETLVDIHPNARSIAIRLSSRRNGSFIMERVLHGCYARGKNIAYYKPTERATGALWSSHFVDPKTKKVRFYEVYGGKLAGILTQSLCREMFFDSLEGLEWALRDVTSADIIGQFHDEIVVNWRPDPYSKSLASVVKLMENYMTRPAPHYAGFPMDAEIKYAYRYIK